MLQATPASWRLLLAAGWTGKRDLKALCGGEALPADLAAALVDCAGELWNMYGPTETTIWSTVGRVSDATETITIGRPIANTQTFILETSGQLAPVGVVGELCIGGEGVARGYRKRPELTAEKFVPVKLPDGRTVRLYRTGDLARFRGDGALELLGRRDHQVKVRGYRVELGEIEAVLAGCPGVKACVVVARAFSAGDERLVAYVTLQDGIAFDAETARAALRRQAARVHDTCLVRRVAGVAADTEQQDSTATRCRRLPYRMGHAERPTNVLMTPEQRRVAGLWREVLRVDHVGLNENFFDARRPLAPSGQVACRSEAGIRCGFPAHRTVPADDSRQPGGSAVVNSSRRRLLCRAPGSEPKGNFMVETDMSEEALRSLPVAGDRHRRPGGKVPGCAKPR